MNANHTIEVSFTVITYTITSAAGEKGSADPSGDITVSYGGTQTFAFTPDPGCRIRDVLTDGSSVGPVSTYTFSDVKANHTLVASFEEIPVYTISVTAGPNGTVSPSGLVNVPEGKEQTFTFTPDPDYMTVLRADGELISEVSSYTFKDVQSDHTLEVSFRRLHTITVTPASHGTITPSGTVTVPQGDSQNFAFLPDEGYLIRDVLINGESVGSVSAYTFRFMNGDYTLEVIFEKIIYSHTIAVTTGQGGTVTPSGLIVIEEGKTQEFAFTPDDGYTISQILIDGLLKEITPSFTFEGITTDHTLVVMFEKVIDAYIITAEAGEHGTVTPAGTVSVPKGGEQKFVFTPDDGYEVDYVSAVRDDGTQEFVLTPETDGARGPGSESSAYTFKNVNADYFLKVFFKMKKDACIITAKAGEHGSVTPSGDVVVSKGKSKTFTFIPDAGYQVDHILVADEHGSQMFEFTPDSSRSIRKTSTYTFRNISRNYALDVFFEKTGDTYPAFETGMFTVGGTGVVRAEYLYDGSPYQGELGIFSLREMEPLLENLTEFVREAATRAVSDSEDGHVVISDIHEGARLIGSLGGDIVDWNTGPYNGIKSFDMKPGDAFALIFVPNSTLAQLLLNPEPDDPGRRALFSLTASDHDHYGMRTGQIADVDAMGNTFVFEDIEITSGDMDYNDFIFRLAGATAEIPTLDSLISEYFGKKRDPQEWFDWRTSTDLGSLLIEHIQVPPVQPEDAWISAESSSAGMTVYDSDEKSCGKESCSIPGANVEISDDGHLTVALPPLQTDSCSYRLVFHGAENGLISCTVKGRQGDTEILSQEIREIQISSHQVLKSDMSASVSEDGLNIFFGEALPPEASDGTPLPYDFDADGDISGDDISRITSKWGACQGDAEYDMFYDLDDDGCVGFSDMMTVANSWYVP